MRLVFLTYLLIAGLPLHAADLVTRDGKTYPDYRVVSHDAGFVMILDRDGGARIKLADLPAELQRQFDYDPAVAEAFVRQFQAADLQERNAVIRQQSKALSATAASIPASAVPARAQEQTPPTVAATDNSGIPATTSDETEAPGLDLGYDPLKQGAEILHTEDDSSYLEGDYVAYDAVGQLWVSSADAEGVMHWYRYAHAGAPGQELRYFSSNGDLPDGAVVTVNGAGYWVVTYRDQNGVVHQSWQEPNRLHLERGTWYVRAGRDGRFYAARDHESGRPQDLHYFHLAQGRPASSGVPETFYFNPARPGPDGVTPAALPSAGVSLNPMISSGGNSYHSGAIGQGAASSSSRTYSGTSNGTTGSTAISSGAIHR